MKAQDQLTIHQQLNELGELYYTMPLAEYEAALQSAIQQFQQVSPAFTIYYLR